MFQTNRTPKRPLLTGGGGPLRELIWASELNKLGSEDPILSPRGIAADNVVSLDNGGNAHTGVPVLNSGLDAQNFSKSVYQDFRTICYIRRQSEDQVEPRTRLRILIHYEVKTSCGNVTGLGLLRINYLIGGDSNKNRQSQIIAPTCATLSNAPHFAYTPRTNRFGRVPFFGLNLNT
jgi:hypothetical protein